MLTGATLFGVVLVLVIVVSFGFLLIRKPSFSFGGISTEPVRLETKSRNSRDGTKRVSRTCPKYLGYLRGIPENTPIPNECLTCTKMVECQGLDMFRREEAPEKAIEIAHTLKASEKPLEPVEPQKILEKRQAANAPPKHVQERPSGCLNFFGYLRNLPENTLIPDECLSCSKMVGCQEFDAFRSEDVSKKAKEIAQTVRGSEKHLEQVESQRVVKEIQVATAPIKHVQERPSGCLNYFGYLRNMPKNTLIPDECLGCSKMVECLYYSNPE